MESILNTPEVDRLVTLVEEAARATAAVPKRFVEPARGTLDRSKARRHQIVFGRRGSGKTSLLLKARNDLSLDRRPTAFVDLETFKGHCYPDVLLSVLIEAFREFDKWLDSTAVTPATKTTWWMRWFGSKPRKPPLDRERVNEIRQRIQSQIRDLESQLHAEDNAELSTRSQSERSQSSSDSANVGIAYSGVGVGVSAEDSEKSAELYERTEKTRRSKVEFLHRHIMDYQTLFDEIVALSDGDSYIFLDDLYHIRRADQASVLDYFHRIAKGKGLWLKVGTIRHRSRWYRHSDPPIGMKLGDDCEEIDLDITLEKFAIAREFLLKVLDQLAQEAGLKSHTQILANGGVERLVLASGGVARDFLTICRKSIDVARERIQKGSVARGPRVGAEDVNNAAGEHDASKREELRRDTADERDLLEDAFSRVRDFCLSKKVNCLLIDRDKESKGTQIIGELVDLRLMHLVASRTTARGKKGRLFRAYMLDVSQYAGERKRRDLELIPFWKEPDRLRRAGLVFDPDEVFADTLDKLPA